MVNPVAIMALLLMSFLHRY